MAQVKTVTVTAPSHWAAYLINGDSSGFSYSNDEADEKACYEFEEKYGSCVEAVEVGFLTSNDAGTLAADCSEYTFIVR